LTFLCDASDASQKLATRRMERNIVASVIPKVGSNLTAFNFFCFEILLIVVLRYSAEVLRLGAVSTRPVVPA
jgi:hypothetical protein